MEKRKNRLGSEREGEQERIHLLKDKVFILFPFNVIHFKSGDRITSFLVENFTFIIQRALGSLRRFKKTEN